MHTALIVIATYLQLYIARKSYVHAFACTLKLIDTATPFWVAAGYVQAW